MDEQGMDSHKGRPQVVGPAHKSAFGTRHNFAVADGDRSKFHATHVLTTTADGTVLSSMLIHAGGGRKKAEEGVEPPVHEYHRENIDPDSGVEVMVSHNNGSSMTKANFPHYARHTVEALKKKGSPGLRILVLDGHVSRWCLSTFFKITTTTRNNPLLLPCLLYTSPSPRDRG